MEELGLLEEWLENEKKLRPLLESMRPLLEKRLELEEKLPSLRYLASTKEVLPREALPLSSTISIPPPPPERQTMLLDNRAPIPGQPPRHLPSESQLEKLAERKRKNNRKKHLKEKEKVKEAKRLKKEGLEKMEEDLEKGKEK